MAKYSEFNYGTGVVYGEERRVAFSAEPVTATALNYSKVEVTWSTPAGTVNAETGATVGYVGFRIVRNQEAFPETEEDGVVLYEHISPLKDENPDKNSLIDTAENVTAPLISGRFAYYRAWILVASNGEWAVAGDAYTLVPSPHKTTTGANTVETSTTITYDALTDSYIEETRDVTAPDQTLLTTHDRFLGFIPRVFLTEDRGPLDEINSEYPNGSDYSGLEKNTLISNYLSAFSFQLDSFLTYADLIIPDVTGKSTSPAILELQSQQLGLPIDPLGITKTQKKLVREVMYAYSKKGSLTGLRTVVEAMSGYDANLTLTNNLLLSVQDSTFYTGKGSWVASENGSIVAVDGIAAPDEARAIDKTWAGQFSSSTAAVFSLGKDSPVTRGVPITAGGTYSLSYYLRHDTSGAAATVTPSITWYTNKGVEINNVGGPASSSTTTWAKNWYVLPPAPANAAFVGISLSVPTHSVFFVDQVQLSVTGLLTAEPSYEEARGVNVFLLPAKTNYIKNPSFELDTDLWETDAVSISIVSTTASGVYSGPIGARCGTKKLVLTTKATGATYLRTTVQVPSAGFYTLSFYGANEGGDAVIDVQTRALDAQGRGIWLDSAGADLDNDVPANDALRVSKKYTSHLTAITMTATWERHSSVVYIREGQVADEVKVTLTLTDNNVNYELDAVQFEKSYGATDYFDGSIKDAAWQGGLDARHAAISYYYPNRDSKTLRLGKEVEDFLPYGTPYFVEFYRNSALETEVFFGIS